VTDKPPIPPTIWRRLLAFIRDERSGSITIQVDRGVIRKMTLCDQTTETSEVTAAGSVSDSN